MSKKAERDGKKGDGEVGGTTVSSRIFDLLNSMIYDLKRSVDLREGFTKKIAVLLDFVQFFCHLFISSFFGHDLIPNCLLLHLEAGRNFETFIASTFGYKPSSSTVNKRSLFPPKCQ